MSTAGSPARGGHMPLNKMLASGQDILEIELANLSNQQPALDSSVNAPAFYDPSNGIKVNKVLNIGALSDLDGGFIDSDFQQATMRALDAELQLQMRGQSIPMKPESPVKRCLATFSRFIASEQNYEDGNESDDSHEGAMGELDRELNNELRSWRPGGRREFGMTHDFTINVVKRQRKVEKRIIQTSTSPDRATTAPSVAHSPMGSLNSPAGGARGVEDARRAASATTPERPNISNSISAMPHAATPQNTPMHPKSQTASNAAPAAKGRELGQTFIPSLGGLWFGLELLQNKSKSTPGLELLGQVVIDADALRPQWKGLQLLGHHGAGVINLLSAAVSTPRWRSLEKLIVAGGDAAGPGLQALGRVLSLV